jgi:tetratricopeptide (TPR) repeat protein/serine/threonine protein kinase
VVRGSPDPAPASQEGPGATIGPYKLLELIGEGGMGAVWMAEQREPVQRKVALKIIKAGMDTRQVVARFEAERQALALMDHPNIATVFDGGTTSSGRPYFVMELVKGVPITRYCDEHRLTPRERLELFLPVCHAIQHAHTKGIIHRDVKPANILVAPYDGRPVPKIIDFGVAKATGRRLTERTLFTGFGAVIGTFEYMSPEQAELNNQDIDTRSDIYALGVLLYELLTGTTPLSRERLKQAAFTDVLRIIREEEPARPSTRLSESKDTLPSIAAQRHMEPAKLTKLVHGELDWIVMKALEKDRNRRYETANGLATDVQHYLADEAVQACPPSVAYRFRKFARRNKARLALGGLVLFFLVVLGGGAGWMVRDREVRRAAAAQQIQESLTRARQWVVENKLAVARQELATARMRMGSDPAAFGDLAEEVEALQAELDKLARFRELIDRAQKAHAGQRDQLRFPPGELGRDIGYRLEALACYQVLERDNWLAPLEGGPLGPAQVAQVRQAAYEELLQLARNVVHRQQDHGSGRPISAPEAGRAGLAYLYKADAAFPPTAAFFRVRGQCRKALGEDEEARADEELFRRTPATIALDHYLLATAAYDDGDKAEALKQCEAALRLEPTHYWSLLVLGTTLLDLGQQEQEFTSAAVAFTGCIMQRPDYALAYNMRADAFRKLRRYDEALADYGKGIELDPKDAWPWNDRAVAYLDLRQPDKALADSARAIELDPKFAKAWNNRGTVYLKLGQPGKALADFAEAIDLNPKEAVAWSNRGAAYSDLGQPAKALADCSKAIELNPKFAGAWANRGWAYLVLDQPDKSLGDCSTAIDLDPKFALAWLNRSAAHFRLGQTDQALADSSRAIELDPKDARAWANRGPAYLKLGQPDKALADCSKAVDLDPNFARAWNNRGEAYLALGQPDKALGDCSKAIALDPKYARAWQIRGLTHLNLGHADKAVADWSEALELDPKTAATWNNRGTAYLRLGQPEKAVADYSKAIELDSKLASAWANRGNALFHQGKYAEAEPEYREALRLRPDYPVAIEGLAQVLRRQGKPAAAAHLCAEAFAVDPKLTDDPGTQIRYNAACYAAVAGCGQGKDAAKLDDTERARWRRQALDWLRADLAAWTQLLEKRPEQVRARVQQDLRYWQQDADFAGVRGDGLANLPEAERQGWQQLWADVEQTLKNAEANSTKGAGEKSPK